MTWYEKPAGGDACRASRAARARGALISAPARGTLCGFPAALLVVLLLLGCGQRGPDRPMNCLQVRLKKDPPTLDPALIVDLDSARIAAKLYRGLVRFDEALNPVPDCARTWSVSPDGLTYTFILKEGVRFFNGQAVTAADFAYSFQRVLDPATRSPRTWVLSRIEGAKDFMTRVAAGVSGIRVRGTGMLEIKLEAPFAPFVSLLGLTAAYAVPRGEVERWGLDFGFNGSGAGPFTLAEWRHNQHIRLKVNEHGDGKKPRLSGICYRIIPEDFTTLVEFEKGNLDLLPEIAASDYGRFAGDPGWEPYIKRAGCLNTYYLGLNCRVPPFTDPRVRQALNFAIDRQKILSTLLEGRGTLARGPLPPALRGGAPPAGYAYDPERARRLLAAAGYPDGLSMTIYQAADIENLDICQVIQSYLRDVGIRADIVQLEWSSFLEAVARGEAQSFWLSWWADYPDAENFLFPLFHSANWGSGGNRSGFRDAFVDERIAAAVTVMNSAQRRERYRQIEKRIIDLAPWVFFWHKAVCSIHQPWLKDYQAASLAVMETGVDWYIERSVRSRPRAAD